MYLQKTLERKLNNTVKEYGLILDDKSLDNKRRTNEEEKKLIPKKKYPIEVRMFSNDDIVSLCKLHSAHEPPVRKTIELLSLARFSKSSVYFLKCSSFRALAIMILL